MTGRPAAVCCRVVINSEDVVCLKQLGRSAGRHAQIHLSSEKTGGGRIMTNESSECPPVASGL